MCCNIVPDFEDTKLYISLYYILGQNIKLLIKNRTIVIFLSVSQDIPKVSNVIIISCILSSFNFFFLCASVEIHCIKFLFANVVLHNGYVLKTLKAEVFLLSFVELLN